MINDNGIRQLNFLVCMGNALTRDGRMEGEMDKGKKEAMDPIMMEEY
jgi:hypothetical protein